MMEILTIRRVANGWVSTPGFDKVCTELSQVSLKPEELAERVRAWAAAQVDEARRS